MTGKDPVGYLVGNMVDDQLGNLADYLLSYLLDNGLGDIVGNLPD
jgi:hypothetical protein